MLQTYLTSVSNVCEAVLRILFCALTHSTNYQKCVLNFPLSYWPVEQWLFSNRPTIVCSHFLVHSRGSRIRFSAGSQMDLSRGLVSCVAQTTKCSTLAEVGPAVPVC